MNRALGQPGKDVLPSWLLEISGISPGNCQEPFLSRAAKMAEEAGASLGIQIHPSLAREEVERLRKLPWPKSLHLPVCSPFFINLATDELDFLAGQVREARERMEECGARVGLFHGFLLTPLRVPNDFKQYRRNLMAHVEARYRYENSFIMSPEVFATPEYAGWLTRVRRGIAVLQQEAGGLEFCLENDFPGVGSGFSRPQDLVACRGALLWVDFGHLWAASLLHGFGFLEGLELLLQTGRVRGVHLHNNLLPPGTPPKNLADHHTHLYLESSVPLRQGVEMLWRYGVRHYTLEVAQVDLQDVSCLVHWIRKIRRGG